jgi:hypothetical protein
MAAARLLVPLAVLAAVSAPALGAGARAGSAPSAQSASKAPLMGVNISNIDAEALSGADAEIAAAAALHARVVRTELQWSVMEPKAAGVNDPRVLAFADRLMADATAHGIRVILLIDSVPCWESSAPPAVLAGCETHSSRANGYPPRNPADFAAFAAFLRWRRSRDGTSPTTSTNISSPARKRRAATRSSCGRPTRRSSTPTRAWR